MFKRAQSGQVILMNEYLKQTSIHDNIAVCNRCKNNLAEIFQVVNSVYIVGV
jgi:hypothetical protein